MRTLEMFNPHARNFQSSLEHFNLARKLQTEIGRLKFSIQKGNLYCFNLWALWDQKNLMQENFGLISHTLWFSLNSGNTEGSSNPRVRKFHGRLGC